MQFSDAFKAGGVAVFAYYAENEDIDCHREMKRTQFGSRFIVEEQPSSVQKDQMDIINKCVLKRKDNISSHFVVGSISTFRGKEKKRKVAAGKT